MAYLSKNIAFSWNKTQLLIAETYGYQKWYHDAFLLLHSGALRRDREERWGWESLCSWKWKHLNNGLSEGPQMPGSVPQTLACSKSLHLREFISGNVRRGWRSKECWWRAGGQTSRWAANQWLVVPVASPDSVAVDLMRQLLGEWGVKVGRKKNMSLHLENLCQNAELNESARVQGQVGVLWGNKIIGQISCSATSLASPFCVFSSRCYLSFLPIPKFGAYTLLFSLLSSLPSNADTGLESFQLTHSKNNG